MTSDDFPELTVIITASVSTAGFVVTSDEPGLDTPAAITGIALIAPAEINITADKAIEINFFIITPQ